MEYNLRPIKADDMFIMFQILSKLGIQEIRNSLTPEKVQMITESFTKKGAKGDLQTYVGFNITMDAVGMILRNLPACRDDIYTFLAMLSDKTKEDISNLSMVEFTKMIIAVIQMDDFKDFFKVVAGLFDQANK